MKRLTAPLLAVLPMSGVGFAGYRSYSQNATQEATRLQAALKIQQATKAGAAAQRTFTPFFTPMAIASCKQQPTLEQAGLVKKEGENSMT